MAELYYKELNDNQRAKIQFVLVNDDGAANDFGRLKTAGMYGGRGLPTVQDDKSSTLMNALSNNNNYPKDDMALLDKNGRMIKYFTSSKSNMNNRGADGVPSAVFEVLKDTYKNPCATDNGKKEGKGNEDKEGGMSELDELRAHCKLSKDTCAACKGRMKRGACALRKKLKCKFMQSEELCKKAKCQYKAPKRGKKSKCKGKGIF